MRIGGGELRIMDSVGLYIGILGQLYHTQKVVLWGETGDCNVEGH